MNVQQYSSGIHFFVAMWLYMGLTSSDVENHLLLYILLNVAAFFKNVFAFILYCCLFGQCNFLRFLRNAFTKGGHLMKDSKTCHVRFVSLF